MLAGVLLLSGVVGRDVTGPDGRPVGRLADLTVSLDGGATPHRVRRLALARRNRSAVLLPWEEVAEVHAGRLRLATADLSGFEVGSLSDALRDDEILLRRDVLDTQVFDVVGQRLARVADVLLARTADSHLEVVGVEVGFGGVLRRLGLRRVSSPTEDVVAWGDLHLTSERGHAVALSAARSAVHRLDPRALAALVARVDVDAAAQILHARGPAVAEQALQATHPDLKARLRRVLPSSRPLLRSGVLRRRHLNRRRG